MPFFLDDERRQEAPRPACPAVLLEEPVSLVAAMEVAAFDRLAEQLLGDLLLLLLREQILEEVDL